MAPRIGISLVPNAADLDQIRDLVRHADDVGLDCVGIQDHPYQRRFADTWTLLSVLGAETERITLFPDVANLPLRPPAPFAKAAATLDLVTNGRVELGLGAGGFWDAIVAMGGDRRSPGESVDALAEAMQVMRLMWSGERTVDFEGAHYRISGLHPGPQPAHPIGIWLGAYKPRMLRLTGASADGWIPSLGGFEDVDALRVATRRVDRAAADAGRSLDSIRRLINVSGLITPPGTEPNGALEDMRGFSGDETLTGPPEFWRESFATLEDIGFDTIVFWPAEPTRDQLDALAELAR